MTVWHMKGSVHMIDSSYHGHRGILGTYTIRGERAMVIDPGPTSMIPGVLEGIEEIGLGHGGLAYVAATHIHLDHTGGSWRLLDLFPNAVFYVHPRGHRHVVETSQLEEAARQLFGDRVDLYGEIRGISEEKIVDSSDGGVIDLGGVRVQVIWTPGHSSHHQSYYIPEEKVMILGDAGGLYSQTSDATIPDAPPPFNPHKTIESLDRLIALEPELICYSHFGYSDRGVEKLEAYKSQILLWNRIIEEGLGDGLSPEELFERIKLEDPMVLQFEESLDRRGMSSFMHIRGFVEYFKWIRSNRPTS